MPFSTLFSARISVGKLDTGFDENVVLSTILRRFDDDDVFSIQPIFSRAKARLRFSAIVKVEINHQAYSHHRLGRAMSPRALRTVLRLSDGDCVVTDIADFDTMIAARVGGVYLMDPQLAPKGLSCEGMEFIAVEFEPVAIGNPTRVRRSIRK